MQMAEHRESPDELEQFYHPDAGQVEYPNAIPKNTAIRNLAALKEGADRGRRLMKKEYEIRNLFSIGDTVVLEAVWRGTLAVPAGNIAAGKQMVAYFAQFFEFEDGKIYRQRNYDRFEPLL